MITNPSAADVLSAVRRELMVTIMPALQGDGARTTLIMIDRMLASVAQRVPLEQQWMADECNRMTAILVECARALEGEPGEAVAALLDVARRLDERPMFAPIPPFDEISRAYREISELFTDAIGCLNDLEGQGIACAPALLTRARAYLHLRAQRDVAALFTMGAPPAGASI